MKIRAYLKGDEHQILELDARELPSIWNRRTLKNWTWKFTQSNPAGHAMIWVAEHKDQLIAHFAAVPFKLKTFDLEFTASHTIGALVDKKYQNRGILKYVGDKLMAEQVEKNVPYTWGFPNQRAHKFENVKLNYNDLLNFDNWLLPKENMVKPEPNTGFRKITQFDNAFDELWQSCSPDYDIAIVRSSTYLNWRYIQRPDLQYFPFGHYEGDKLKGYVVLKLYKEENMLRGHIVDIFARKDDKETLSNLIDGSLSFFIEKAVDEVMVWFWGNPVVEDLFTEKGFDRLPQDRPLILRINKDHKYQEKVKDNSHWYFCMGDSSEIF
jgi:Acetyltransferase (GNAT) domain